MRVNFVMLATLLLSLCVLLPAISVALAAGNATCQFTSSAAGKCSDDTYIITYTEVAVGSNVDICQQYCCPVLTQCVAVVLETSYSPIGSGNGNCVTGHPCCFTYSSCEDITDTSGYTYEKLRS